MLKTASAFVLAACVAAIGCSKSPTAPTQSSSVTAVSILGFSVGNPGFTFPFAIVVQFADFHSETSCLASASTPGCSAISGITWSSSNTQVATINSAGVLTTLKLGSTTITATYQGKTATQSFNVI